MPMDLESRSRSRSRVIYAQQKHTFRLELYPDFSRCAMLWNAQISGIIVGI